MRPLAFESKNKLGRFQKKTLLINYTSANGDFGHYHFLRLERLDDDLQFSISSVTSGRSGG